MPPFFDVESVKPFVEPELLSSSSPVVFQLPNSAIAWGYRAELLPKVCDVYLKARDAGALLPRQQRMALACDLLVRALAHTGIIALVDEATGYQHVRDSMALQQILDAYIGKELAAWAKRFPDEFYRQIFRLKNWVFQESSSKRPMMMAQLTTDLVYSRLAPGVLDELRRKSPKDESGRRKSKLHQWLTPDVGHPALKEHITGLIYLAKSTDTWDKFYSAVNRVSPQFGRTMMLPFPEVPNDPEPSSTTEPQPPSSQSPPASS